jgi:hypothetical protein
VRARFFREIEVQPTLHLTKAATGTVLRCIECRLRMSGE